MEQPYSQRYEAPWGYGEEEAPVIPSLAAQGTIEDYAFPLSVEVGVQAGWSIVVHNVGSDGRFGSGIVNAAGNPGNLTITWNGGETVISPGRAFHLKTINPEAYCRRINEIGDVKFAAEGSYTIKLRAIHEESPGEWFYDDERVVTVNVSGVTPPPNGEVQKTVPFSGRLAPGWALEATDSTPVKDVDLSKLVGGRVDYALSYESGVLTGMNVYIYWNDELIATERLSNVGQTATGTFELGTGRIRATNTLSIKMVQGPLGYNICSFDCPTTLSFSSEPDIDPGGEDWWDGLVEWLDKNKYWIALGGAGVGFLLLYRPSPPVVIYRPPRKGEK